MRSAILIVTTAGLVLGAAASAARAGGPLVDFETGQSPITNVKASRVGDLVTIIITENATANATSKTKANNKSEHSGGPGLGVLDFVKPWGLDVENKYNGDGSTQRGGSLRAEITARIVEVLHSGDYRIEGSRMVNINGEKQLIEIKGVCRARDIGADNTILSTYISDAQIAYNGSGVVADTADPGIVTKVLNWLF